MLYTLRNIAIHVLQFPPEGLDTLYEWSGRKSPVVWGRVYEIGLHSIRSEGLGTWACVHSSFPTVFFSDWYQEKFSTAPKNHGNCTSS